MANDVMATLLVGVALYIARQVKRLSKTMHLLRRDLRGLRRRVADHEDRLIELEEHDGQEENGSGAPG